MAQVMFASLSAPALGSKRNSLTGSKANSITDGRRNSKTDDALPELKRLSVAFPTDSFALGGAVGSRPASRADTAANMRTWMESTSPAFPALVEGGSRGGSRPASAWRGGGGSAATRPASALQGSIVGDDASPRAGFHLLYGISSSIEVQNELHLHSMGATMLRSRTKTLGRSGSKLHSMAATAQMAEEFERDVVGLSSSLDDLSRRHNSFEGHFLDRGNVGKKQQGKKGEGEAKVGKAAEKQDRRERVKAYKWCRKMEPELPPLTLNIGGGDAPPKKEFPCLGKNASEALVSAGKPDMKKEHMESRKKILLVRRNTAVLVAENLLEEQRTKFDDDLKNKEARAGKLLALKEREAAAMRNKGFPADRWFTFMAINAFAKALQEEVKLSHMPPAERVKLAKLKSKQPDDMDMENLSPSMALAARTAALMEETAVINGMGTLAYVYKAKLAIGRQRRSAEKMCSLLKLLRNSGRFFVSMQKFTKTIKRLQVWWRECSKRLKQIHEKMTRRWLKVETQELSKELNVAVPLPSPGSAGKKVFRLSLEERIEIERVDEFTRSRFLEHELRARRYGLLPAIRCWEEDVAKWHRDAEELKVMSDAAQVLSIDKRKTQPQSFNWPPTRPSYMPPDHPSAEKFGNRCPENCHGRKGDAQVLAMYRACLEHRDTPGGGGWKEIPVPRQSLPTASGKGAPKPKGAPSSPSKKRQQKGGNEDQERPFGEPNDEDCDTWKIHPSSMPGIDGPKDIRVAGEGDAE